MNKSKMTHFIQAVLHRHTVATPILRRAKMTWTVNITTQLVLMLVYLCVHESLGQKPPIKEDYEEYVVSTAPPAPEDAVPFYDDDDVVAISRDDLVELHTGLLYSYDTRIRPVNEQNYAISISTKLVPKNIIEFDTSEQRFSFLGYFVVEWKDEQIIWDPDNYGGTNFVKLPVKDIWMPNMKIIEEFDGNNYIGDMETDIAKISSDGDVQWVPEGMYSVVCEVDIQYYPYDEQQCTFTYYIASETNKTVILEHKDEVTLDEFIENSAWKLIKIEREQELKWETYFIHVHFHLQRRAHFATFTVVTPLLMLAFLNIGVFIVPNGSGEKGTFAITIFLSYGIFISIVSDTLPHNSLQVSYFVVFIISLLGVSALTVFYAIFQAKLFATIGNLECKLPWSKSSTNKVEPLERSENGENSERPEDAGNQTNEKYTWGMLLDKIDTIMCISFFVLVVGAAVIFFCIMLNHLAQELEDI